MKTLSKGITKIVCLTAIALLAVNCSDDKAEDLLETQEVTATDVQTILNTDDISSAADDIVTDIFSSAQAGTTSKSEDCQETEFTDTGVTVMFNDCSTEDGLNINGSVSITYVTGQENAFSATYTNLSIGEYEINGTRSFTIGTDDQEGFSLTVTSDMTIKIPDGTTIEEQGSKVISVVLDFNNFENSGVSIDGEWTVKADGDTYTINITAPLEVKGQCEYVGKGIMELSKNGLQVDVDFGDGTCDDKANLTYPDGTVEEISLDDEV